MTTGTEALVRRAYQLAEGDVLDAQAFRELFAEDGVFTGIGGTSAEDSYRELLRVDVLGDVVAIEVSIEGTFRGPFETPAGVIQPTGAKIAIPTADFWYVRDGKIQEFRCHLGFTTFFAQIGVMPDFASVVAASAPGR